MRQPLESARTTKESPGPQSDRQSFAQQFQAAYPTLWRIAAGMIGDRTHAEDIVQEAAIIGLSKLEGFRPGSNFVAWMAAIVRRCALNYSRKVRNRATVATDPVMLDQSERSADVDSSTGPIVSKTGSLNEAQDAFDDHLLRGLMALSDEARCCVLLRIVEELSYAEISELMQIAQGTAMSHVHRGKSLLRRYVQGADPPATKGNHRS